MDVPLEQALEGDVLAAGAAGADGKEVLPAGTGLTVERLDLLRSRGVLTVNVRRSGIPGGEEVERAIGELDHMFSDVRGDPIMDRIYDVARAMLERVRHRE